MATVAKPRGPRGGARPGSGAPRKCLLEVVQAKTFKPFRHLHLFASDASILTYPGVVPAESVPLHKLGRLQLEHVGPRTWFYGKDVELVRMFVRVMLAADLVELEPLPRSEELFAEIVSGRRRPMFVEFDEARDCFRVATP